MRALGEAGVALRARAGGPAPPSIRQSKLEPPTAEKSKLAPWLFVGLVGALSICVSGATVSTVQVKLAGEASVLPAASVARTWKVCEPSARPV